MNSAYMPKTLPCLLDYLHTLMSSIPLWPASRKCPLNVHVQPSSTNLQIWQCDLPHFLTPLTLLFSLLILDLTKIFFFLTNIRQE